MKTIAAFFLAMLLLLGSSCSKDEVQMGCMTGIPKGSTSNNRVKIKCCTQDEFFAGDNTAAGGDARLWNMYTDHKWAAVNSCSECN